MNVCWFFRYSLLTLAASLSQSVFAASDASWDGEYSSVRQSTQQSNPLLMHMEFNRSVATVPAAPGLAATRENVPLYGLQLTLGIPVVTDLFSGNVDLATAIGGRYPATVARKVTDLSAWIWLVPSIRYHLASDLAGILLVNTSIIAGAQFGRMSYPSAAISTVSTLAEANLRLGLYSLTLEHWTPILLSMIRYEGGYGTYKSSGDPLTLQSAVEFGPPTLSVKFSNNGNRTALAWQVGIGIENPVDPDTPKSKVFSVAYFRQDVTHQGLRELNNQGQISKTDVKLREHGIKIAYSHGF